MDTKVRLYTSLKESSVPAGSFELIGARKCMRLFRNLSPPPFFGDLLFVAHFNPPPCGGGLLAGVVPAHAVPNSACDV